MIVGIIGSGQLGYMMIITMKKYPLKFYVLDDNKGPAGYIADKFFTVNQYREFVDSCDFVTFEFEHVDKNTLEYASERGKLRPNIKTIELKRDRSLEKNFLKKNHFPIADYEYADTYKEAFNIAKDFNNAVIKTCKGGYDGKGQFYINPETKYKEENVHGPFVIERFINYDFEASIIAVRDSRGTFEFFSPSYNYNKNGILIYNIAPLKDHKKMVTMAQKLMEKLDYIGVMGIEYYVTDNDVKINEYAPRVHNTGHHTLLGSSISQFEEHIHAVADIPVVKPALFSPSGILNIIGTEIHDKVDDILNLGKSDIYWYHKADIRRKRKMGHINVYGKSVAEVREKIDKLINIVYNGNIDNFI